MFLKNLRPYELILAALLENKQVSLLHLYSRASFCCHHKILIYAELQKFLWQDFLLVFVSKEGRKQKSTLSKAHKLTGYNEELKQGIVCHIVRFISDFFTEVRLQFSKYFYNSEWQSCNWSKAWHVNTVFLQLFSEILPWLVTDFSRIFFLILPDFNGDLPKHLYH